MRSGLVDALVYQDWFYNWALFPFAVVLAAALLWIPGLIIGVAAGIRGIRLAAWAPSASVFVFTTAGVLAPYFGLRWGLLPALAMTCTIAILCLVSRLLWRLWCSWRKSTRIEPNRNKPVTETVASGYAGWVLPTIAGVTFLSATVVFGFLIRLPGAFAQTWDNVFHMNAIAAILDTGNASIFNQNVYNPTAPVFYPAAWHDLVSLLTVTTGIPAPTAVNANAVIVAFLAWPLGIFLLARQLVGDKRVALFALPAAVIFPQFPLMFLNYGTLYPNFLAMAFLPLLVEITVGVLRETLPVSTSAFAALVVFAALCGAQPNVAILYVPVAIVLCGAFSVYRVWTSLLATRWLRALIIVPVTVAWTAVGFLFNWLLDQVHALSYMRTGYQYWPESGSLPRGILELVLWFGGEPIDFPGLLRATHLFPLGLLVLSGMVVVALKYHKKLIFILYALFAVFFLVAYTVSGDLRTYLLGIWYCDIPRLTAPLVMLAPIFVGAVGAGVWEKIVNQTDSWALRGIAAAGMSLCLVMTGGWAWVNLASYFHQMYDIPAASESAKLELVDQDELQLFFRMRSNLPPNAIVAANPWEGGTFAWAIGGTQTLFPKITANVETDRSYLAQHLKDAATDPQVCPLIKKFKVTHALDLSNIYMRAGSGFGVEWAYPGLDGTADAGIGPVVDQQGQAKLVKITVCG
ncbi:DUF6541 family protein [uncultured Mobiluncus sp.]|uniref:DUF6541 family protein n=1 Tax=uncultured Mobiluncus sp. TaxID=293425 RepID=UPI002613217B|nr:DUF6541 family protein [uncultured Mobiluncus sp.]